MGEEGQKELPAVEDFGVHRPDDLDGRHAVRMFLGKTCDEAVGMFRENFLFYQEDLMWMGGRAFSFYVKPAMQYLWSKDSDGDSDAANTFCGLMEFRWEHDRASVEAVRDDVIATIRAILEGFSRYECDPEIYGDVQGRYRRLLHAMGA